MDSACFMLKGKMTHDLYFSNSVECCLIQFVYTVVKKKRKKKEKKDSETGFETSDIFSRSQSA